MKGRIKSVSNDELCSPAAEHKEDTFRPQLFDEKKIK